MKLELFVAVTLWLVPAAMSAQRLDRQLFVARAASHANATLQLQPQGSCPGRRIAAVAFPTVAGAALAWLMYTATIGALASDHGTVYKRQRRVWVIGGGIVGAVVGTYRALTMPCNELPVRAAT